MPLSRGIWYEERHDRFRVRIYRNGRVAHLSYHKTVEEAESTLTQFKNSESGSSDIFKLVEQAKIYYSQRRNHQYA